MTAQTRRAAERRRAVRISMSSTMFLLCSSGVEHVDWITYTSRPRTFSGISIRLSWL